MTKAKDFPLKDPVAPVRWRGERLEVLDQRLLPAKILYLNCRNPESVAKATRDMALRGAPLIGVAAAYGMALAARQSSLASVEKAAEILRRARPTAVNLAHAVERMLAVARRSPGRGMGQAVAREAERFHAEDLAANQAMARLGASLLAKNSRVITYCNAGALATSGLGTSLGVIRYAHYLGKIEHVYPCETRPYLQGSRLTLWELMRAKVPATLITDNMAAHLMKISRIDAVIVGSDRIAANADVCNKIGTYGLAILARHHGIPFYAVAPSTTIDFACPDGSRIPIEERGPDEVLKIFGRPIAPSGAKARHFAFDVTPHGLVSAIVTERGIASPANAKKLKELYAG
ncbi:MAG: S-methyl-5-thioribose-1-phosphate isomerase [Elusimicrobia bacterium]|nr:S-methyl-5-thioribose-1-phosphate isomerase [Elusimicrobiota bacterium]